MSSMMDASIVSALPVPLWVSSVLYPGRSSSGSRCGIVSGAPYTSLSQSLSTVYVVIVAHCNDCLTIANGLIVVDLSSQ
eukprot:3974547-Amphidinium_carterae.1